MDVCGRSKGQLGCLAASGTSLWGGREQELRLYPGEVSWAQGLRRELGGGGALPDSGGAVLTVIPNPLPRAGKMWEALRFTGLQPPPSGSQPSPQPAVLSKGEVGLIDCHLKSERALGAGAHDLLVLAVPGHTGPGMLGHQPKGDN